MRRWRLTLPRLVRNKVKRRCLPSPTLMQAPTSASRAVPLGVKATARARPMLLVPATRLGTSRLGLPTEAKRSTRVPMLAAENATRLPSSDSAEESMLWPPGTETCSARTGLTPLSAAAAVGFSRRHSWSWLASWTASNRPRGAAQQMSVWRWRRGRETCQVKRTGMLRERGRGGSFATHRGKGGDATVAGAACAKVLRVVHNEARVDAWETEKRSWGAALDEILCACGVQRVHPHGEGRTSGKQPAVAQHRERPNIVRVVTAHASDDPLSRLGIRKGAGCCERGRERSTTMGARACGTLTHLVGVAEQLDNFRINARGKERAILRGHKRVHICQVRVERAL